MRLVEDGTIWLDVGCGHDLFPTNEPLARLLSSRAGKLVWLDPNDNIDRNTLVHERAKCFLEEYESNQTFDVIRCRRPRPAHREWRARGCLYRQQVVSRVFGSGFDTDGGAPRRQTNSLGWTSGGTFPTVYHMNTRKQSQRLFKAEGFVEESFLYLDDCRALARWRLTSMIELLAQRALRAVGLRYPDVCLLGIYRKLDSRSPA